MKFSLPFTCLFSLAAVLPQLSCAPQNASSAAPPKTPTAKVQATKVQPTKVQTTAKPAAKASSADEAKHLALLKKQDIALVAGLRGQLLRLSMPYSERLKRKSNVWVYLPPDYQKTDARYPVAYILHGAPGGVRDCFVNARVHRVAEKLITTEQIAPLILVGWDGTGPKGVEDTTYYLNRRDGIAMEDFTVRELVPWIDAHFRTRANAQSRALIGFSAGGYGAANLGLKHPDVWAVMASHSGFFDPNDDPKAMKRFLGPPGPLWQQNSPLRLVRALPTGTRLHLYMDVGADDDLLDEFKTMEAELQARQIDFEAHIFPGDHTWEFLTQHYHDSLRFADERWKEMARE